MPEPPHVVEHPAWVVVAPPDFAPAIDGIVTLYDLLREVAVKRGWIQPLAKPSASVKISAGGASETVKVEWNVVDSGPGPKFTYLAGPEGCQTPAGYPDAALCNPLDQSAIGRFVSPVPGAFAAGY